MYKIPKAIINKLAELDTRATEWTLSAYVSATETSKLTGARYPIKRRTDLETVVCRSSEAKARAKELAILHGEITIRGIELILPASAYSNYQWIVK